MQSLSSISLALGLAVSPTAPAIAADEPAFDYVVVGAGAAGSVVASRLSEDDSASVLVLEAGGPDDDPRIARPSAYRELPGSSLDWKFLTEEEPHLANRRIPWPRGKVWGGSGAISAMVYVRGPARDFDRWRELGNEGWGFADVLPFFRKAENHEGGPSFHHGTGGPQNVADPRFVPPLSAAFLEAAREIGLPRSDDWNGASAEGAGLYPLNQKNGERHSASDAYLRPALVRRNLRIESHALVTRVLVRDGRAEGVAYVQEGRARVARARREVVLCAGAIGSPQILLLSGIGPAAQLRELGIPVVVDLPGVGANLQDHPRVALTWESKAPLGPSPAEQEEARRAWARDRTGPLTNSGLGAGAFVRTLPALELPDVQIVPVGNAAASTVSLNVALMRPASRGALRLRSKDPSAPPLIRANYLGAPGDLDTLLRGLAVARRLAAAPALAALLGQSRSPGEGEGPDALERHVRENATTFFHPVGTCRMGNDPDAVVDAGLRVRGVRGLRVIDASVMPTLVGGATHAAAVMIAEKGADLIKRQGPRVATAVAGP
jgi:choline dehydrogenase